MKTNEEFLRKIYKEKDSREFMEGVSKLFVIGLLSIFMISMFSGFVAAPSHDADIDIDIGDIKITFLTKAGDAVDGVLGDQSKEIIAKILLTLLVIFIVYSVMTFMPFIPEGKGGTALRWMISIILGILSFLFVGLNDIKAIVDLTSAMGIGMVSILPLAILITFMVQISKENRTMALFLNPMMTIGFFIYIFVQEKFQVGRFFWH